MKGKLNKKKELSLNVLEVSFICTASERNTKKTNQGKSK